MENTFRIAKCSGKLAFAKQLVQSKNYFICQVEKLLLNATKEDVHD